MHLFIHIGYSNLLAPFQKTYQADTAGLNGFDSTQIRLQQHEQLSIKAIIP